MESQKYSRQQAIKLSGCTSSRLAYLDILGWVVPERIGADISKKPVCLYTEEQINLIKSIEVAGNYFDPGIIRRLIEKGKLDVAIKAIQKVLGETGRGRK